MDEKRITPEEAKVVGRAGVTVFPTPFEAMLQNRQKRPLKYAIRSSEPGSMEDLATYRIKKKTRKK